MKLRYIVRAYIPRMSGETMPADSIPMTEEQAKTYAGAARWHHARIRVEVIPTPETAQHDAEALVRRNARTGKALEAKKGKRAA